MMMLRTIEVHMWEMVRDKKNEEVKKVPVFKPVAKAEHIYFEKDMMFTTPK